MTSDVRMEPHETQEKVKPQKKNVHDNTSTLDNNDPVLEPQASENESVEIEYVEETKPTDVARAEVNTKPQAEEAPNAMFAILPRIVGKIGGTISKEDIFDKRGIYTETDVEVVEFELHIATTFGSKVLRTRGNQLTNEMRAALMDMQHGEEVFFEGIMGEVAWRSGSHAFTN